MRNKYLAACLIHTVSILKHSLQRNPYDFLLKHKKQPQSAFQTSLTLVKCSHHPAYDSILPLCRWRDVAEGSARRHSGPERSAGSWGLQWPSSHGTPLMSSTAAPNMSPHSSTISHIHRQSEWGSSARKHSCSGTAAAGARTLHTYRAKTCLNIQTQPNIHGCKNSLSTYTRLTDVA